ncbi:uncharacterized protein LOC124147880 isoform X9 [Haliotis rufescens]|uniref:uncharacterized protein LOC124147880 isoform X9 n=1 Tax=Haliotis rufescens TaxID=6454 RepID=UPI00201F587B|nr:uncharacterized protein LOC124147880 isoform X9 [Haliotis rufescens]
MAAVLKLCVVLICLGLVESFVGDCPCDKCKIMKHVSVRKPTGYRRTCTGYTIGYVDRFVSCRRGCRCPKGPIPR